MLPVPFLMTAKMLQALFPLYRSHLNSFFFFLTFVEQKHARTLPDQIAHTFMCVHLALFLCATAFPT